MKKLFTFFIILLITTTSFGQSWKCFTPGSEQFFTNNYGFMKGMRIDSITGSGAGFVYHPFRTLRIPVGTYSTSGPIDSNGGSWLGKNVVAKMDGTFLFDNIWGDTIKIRTRGNVGDTWVFYDDGSDHYYEATISSLDTMSVLGIPDSVKHIILIAYQNGIYAPNDSFDNAEIILSKSNGFVQVPDLYNFPYHATDTSYSLLKLDYIYYMSIVDPSFYLTNVNWGFNIDMSVVPGKYNGMFRRSAFPNPSHAQLGNGWNVGDVIHRNICPVSTPSCVVNGDNRFLDTIVQKNVTSNGVEYFYRGQNAQGPLNDIHYYPDSSYITYTNNVLIRDQAMPEEINVTMAEPWFYYYLPDDTSYCTNGALYHKIYANISMGQPLWFDIFSRLTTESFKEGLGSVRYHWYIWDGLSGWVNNTTLKFFVRDGIPCGTDFVLPLGLSNQPLATGYVHLYPNPAYGELKIEVPANSYELSLLNTMGQVVYNKPFAQAKERIDVSRFANGVYYLRIKTTKGEVMNKKVVVQN